jgi:hypothetical protein
MERLMTTISPSDKQPGLNSSWAYLHLRPVITIQWGAKSPFFARFGGQVGFSILLECDSSRTWLSSGYTAQHSCQYLFA